LRDRGNVAYLFPPDSLSNRVTHCVINEILFIPLATGTVERIHGHSIKTFLLAVVLLLSGLDV